MAEFYAAARDAYVHGNVQAGKVKAKRGLKLPWYMRDPDAAKPKGKSGQALWDAVDRMNAGLSAGPKKAN